MSPSTSPARRRPRSGRCRGRRLAGRGLGGRGGTSRPAATASTVVTAAAADGASGMGLQGRPGWASLAGDSHDGRPGCYAAGPGRARGCDATAPSTTDVRCRRVPAGPASSYVGRQVGASRTPSVSGGVRRRPRTPRVVSTRPSRLRASAAGSLNLRALTSARSFLTPHSAPSMNASTRRRPSSSGSCTGGLFMRYDDAPMSGPPMPRSSAIFAARIASMMMPAELGESQTSSLYSMLSGTSPNARPSSRT